ncbi:MAG: type II toxin-antitoxin system VapC family toxin [Desulfobulbaceae bacterium]|jgi:PIN domain nuclease of toxin-antitoxin system|nr:type II toxin-antitoxin system VapC family toxin [Desulfobulbaceae bacterium]
MNYLLDSQMLIWAASGSRQLPEQARELITDMENEIFFSAASLWEIATKAALRRADFQIDPDSLLQGLLANDYQEIAIASSHAIAVRDLPPIHRDPFDRLLIVQAKLEKITLLTSDATMARYDAPIFLL